MNTIFQEGDSVSYYGNLGYTIQNLTRQDDNTVTCNLLSAGGHLYGGQGWSWPRRGIVLLKRKIVIKKIHPLTKIFQDLPRENQS